MILWAALFFVSCGAALAHAQTDAFAQAIPRPVGREVNELPPPGYLGHTDCRGGVPVTRIDPTLDSITAMEVRLHEQFHRLQLAMGCDSLVAVWSAAGREYAEAEAQATCYAMHGMGYTAATIARSVEEEATRLAGSTRVPAITRDTILAFFRVACATPVGAEP